MGLTERHWFENEDVPENYEWTLEDAVYNSSTNKKHDDDIVPALLIGKLKLFTDEQCKDCKYYDGNGTCMKNGIADLTGRWFYADGEREKVIKKLDGR